MAFKDPDREKEYDYLYKVNYRQSQRDKAFAFLGKQCIKCKSCTDLEFDHINPEEKSFTISQGLDYAWSKLKQELTKCQVLCKNCHKAKTAQEQKKEIRHGTRKGYDKGCRCEFCREAKTTACRLWYRRKHNLTPDQYRVD